MIYTPRVCKDMKLAFYAHEGQSNSKKKWSLRVGSTSIRLRCQVFLQSLQQSCRKLLPLP